MSSCRVSKEIYNLNKSKEQGLISVNRNSKATLTLTIPRPLLVVCKGFIIPNISINLHGRTQVSLTHTTVFYDLGRS